MKNNILFISVICFMLIAIVVNMDYFSEVSVAENKKMAEFPSVNPFHERFPKKMDNYIDDRIGFKYFAVKTLGKYIPSSTKWSVQKNNSAIIGQDGWIFYNRDSETIEDYQHIMIFSEQELTNLSKAIEDVAQWCEENNIKFYMLIPPNKHNVYPEYYIESWYQLPVDAKYDVFKKHLESSGGGAHLIDVKYPLLEEKKIREVYIKNDTHWNFNGGYRAYREIMKAIKKDFPTIYEISESDIEYFEQATAEGDLTQYLANYSYNYPPVIQPRAVDNVSVKIKKDSESDQTLNNAITTSSNTDAPRSFIVHDSFFDFILPFIYKSFSLTINKKEWNVSPLKYKQEILDNKTDILIWEMHERYLKGLAAQDNSF